MRGELLYAPPCPNRLISRKKGPVVPLPRARRRLFHAPPAQRRYAMPKTEMSRFPIHDDLTAPEASLPILKGASSAAGQLPNFLGVLAGSPAALRAFARFRAELRRGTLAGATIERIALAVAEHFRSEPGL